MTENYTYAPVERVVLTTAEFAALRDTAARLEAALLECVAQEATVRGELAAANAKLAAVPVGAIWRIWRQEYTDQWEGDSLYDVESQWADDSDKVDEWLAQFGEVQA